MSRTLRLRGERIITFQHMEMMGIINVTPDSFFEGSRVRGGQEALAKAGRHIAEGARMIDIGGESTRPGAEPVTEEEEIARICPVISRLRELYPDIVISADTYRAGTARAALECGADMINDISGLTFEPALAEVIAEADAAVVLMHTGGRPDTMQENPQYDNVMEEVYQFLQRQKEFALSCGIGADQIMVDMGIGFGKDLQHNLLLLQNIERFNTLECPQLLAVSRKSFIGKLLKQENPEERLAGTIACTAFAAQRGVAAARVHDVRENLEAARIAEALIKRDI